jgi:hypothetical protein
MMSDRFAALARISSTTAIRRTLMVLALGCVMNSPALAAPISFELRGTTNSAYGSLDSLFPSGTEVALKLTYDTDWAEMSSWPGTYNFNNRTPTTHFDYSVEVGGRQFAWTRQGNVYLHVDPDRIWFDTSLSEITLGGAPAGSFFPVAFDFSLPGVYPPGTLPSALPTDGAGSSFSFYMNTSPSCGGCGYDAGVSGNFREVKSVPTPSTLTLLGLGMAGLAAWRRRRA